MNAVKFLNNQLIRQFSVQAQHPEIPPTSLRHAFLSHFSSSRRRRRPAYPFVDPNIAHQEIHTAPVSPPRIRIQNLSPRPLSIRIIPFTTSWTQFVSILAPFSLFHTTHEARAFALQTHTLYHASKPGSTNTHQHGA